MTVYILTAVLLIAAWQLLAWRVHRVIAARIEKSIVATSQRTTYRLFVRQGYLTDDQKRAALAEALAYTETLLSAWHRLFLRITLMRFDLTDWLVLSIENRVYRLKSCHALPVSRSTLMERDPDQKLRADIVTEMFKLISQVVNSYASAPPCASAPTQPTTPTNP